MTAEKILEDLTQDLSYRLEKMDARNGAFWLTEQKEFLADFLIQFSYSHVLRAIERKSTLVEVSSSIGRRLRQKLRLTQDSVLEIHAGWFILISFIDLDLVSYTKEKTKDANQRTSKHRAYVVVAKDWEKLKSLLDSVKHENCDMFPVKEAPDPWLLGDPFHGSTGTPVIKKASISQLKPFEKPTKEMEVLTRTLNRLSSTGWRINKAIFPVYTYFLDHKDTVKDSPFKFHKEIDKQKKKSMLIEVEAIRRLAEKNLDNAFHHLYNFDFRGRVYPNTAFLHEQSSDNAKGILILDEPVELGSTGMKWLWYHAANSWGEDRLRPKERVAWSKDRVSMLCSYANDPYTNQEWLKADKPFSFLACCMEIKAAIDWSSHSPVESFPSCLPVYIDGSNNGVQHLAAISLDEEVAPLVNLVPSDLPGDVYMFIADKVWENLRVMADKLPEKTSSKFDKLLLEGKVLQLTYERAPANSEQKFLAYSELKTWKNNNRLLREQLFSTYWLGITDKKLIRKSVKRPVMTLGYGGSPYGMGQQVIEDTKGLSDYLRDKDYLWGVMLGELVHKTCYEELKGPAKLLRLFESLADRFNEKEKPLCWRSPLTGFPLTQEYKKPKSVRLKLKHKKDILNVQIQVWEEATLNESKQRTGTAPNLVHSLDAVHLIITVDGCNFTVVVVHDSFGCHAGNMELLFRIVRETFVTLYESNPLEFILEQLDSLDLAPKKGTLNVRDILKADYAFA